jgi:hypothetical protein
MNKINLYVTKNDSPIAVSFKPTKSVFAHDVTQKDDSKRIYAGKITSHEVFHQMQYAKDPKAFKLSRNLMPSTSEIEISSAILLVRSVIHAAPVSRQYCSRSQ